MDSGEYKWPYQTSDIGMLTADKPIIVAQVAAASELTVTKKNGDPFFALLPSTNSYNRKYTLLGCFPSFNVDLHFMQIVAPIANVAGVLLDGQPIPMNQGGWVNVSGTTWATITTNLACTGEAKVFRLEHEEPHISIGVLVYGFGDYDSYGYVGGGRLVESQHFCTPTQDSDPPDNIDNDCDGRVDEELPNGLDDDGDGLIDEDLAVSKLYKRNKLRIKVLWILNERHSEASSIHKDSPMRLPAV